MAIGAAYSDEDVAARASNEEQVQAVYLDCLQETGTFGRAPSECWCAHACGAARQLEAQVRVIFHSSRLAQIGHRSGIALETRPHAKPLLQDSIHT
jgi:hypothetical protein